MGWRISAGPPGRGRAAERRSLVRPIFLAFASGVVLAFLVSSVSGSDGPTALDLAFDRAAPDPAGDHADLAYVLTLPGGRVVSLALAAVAGRLLWVRRGDWPALALLVAAYVCASSTSFIVKRVVERVPPRFLGDATHQTGLAFPSANVARVVAILGLVALIVEMQRGKRVATVVLATTALLVVVVGAAQMYLGQHWFTDLLGGLAIGCLWTALLAPATRRLVARQPGGAPAEPGSRCPPNEREEVMIP